MPYGNGLLSSLHLDKYPMLNVSLWKLLSCNDQRNNHEINNKLLLGCSKLHLQWSHNWKHNCTFKSWWYERHNQPLDPPIVHIIDNLIFAYIFNYVIIKGQVFWSLNIPIWFCDLFHNHFVDYYNNGESTENKFTPSHMHNLFIVLKITRQKCRLHSLTNSNMWTSITNFNVILFVSLVFS
jgi:hypothetical protein